MTQVAASYSGLQFWLLLKESTTIWSFKSVVLFAYTSKNFCHITPAAGHKSYSICDADRYHYVALGCHLTCNSMAASYSSCLCSCFSISSICGSFYPMLLSCCQCRGKSPLLSSHLPLLFALFPYGVCQRLSVCMFVSACLCLSVHVCARVCVYLLLVINLAPGTHVAHNLQVRTLWACLEARSTLVAHKANAACCAPRSQLTHT